MFDFIIICKRFLMCCDQANDNSFGQVFDERLLGDSAVPVPSKSGRVSGCGCG